MSKFKVGDVVKTTHDLDSVRHGMIPMGFIEEIDSIEHSSGVEGYVLAGLPDFWVYDDDIVLVKPKDISKCRDDLLRNMFDAN